MKFVPTLKDFSDWGKVGDILVPLHCGSTAEESLISAWAGMVLGKNNLTAGGYGTVRSFPGRQTVEEVRKGKTMQRKPTCRRERFWEADTVVKLCERNTGCTWGTGIRSSWQFRQSPTTRGWKRRQLGQRQGDHEASTVVHLRNAGRENQGSREGSSFERLLRRMDEIC